MKQIVLLICGVYLLLGTSNCCWAQQKHSSQIEPDTMQHEIDFFLGSIHIPDGGKRISDVNLLMPNIGLNNKYWIDDHFDIGWHNNLLIQTIAINSDSHQDLEQENPFVTSAAGIFKPRKNLSIFTGPGLELDTNGSLFVYRFGVDYSISLSNDCYLSPRFNFDILGHDI